MDSYKIWYGACFTAQQAGEKALKAYIKKMGDKYPRIHSLVALLEWCLKFDKSFLELREECATLTIYYAPTRYPDMSSQMDFTEEDARQAYEFAQTIVEFVEKKLE